MADLPLLTANEARFLISVMPIVSALFAVAGRFFLFEQIKEQGEDLGIAVINILLGIFTSLENHWDDGPGLWILQKREALRQRWNIMFGVWYV